MVDSITAQQIEETINIVDPEDAVKYMPSLFVRKRNEGDNQAVLATRTWGVNSSARTLIYADDILLSALLGNNNSYAAPHWNLVAPESIERIDFLEGPFAAAYPGNSMGGVMLITTKMPDKLVMTAKQTEALQHFSLYGTDADYRTDQTSATMGDRIGIFFVVRQRELPEQLLSAADLHDKRDAPSGNARDIWRTDQTRPAGRRRGHRRIAAHE